MNHTFIIPTQEGSLTLSINSGEAIVFVGANGAGKTRLAVEIEKSLGQAAHRVSAHRALSLNADVVKVSERQARQKLSTGWEDEKATVELYRSGNRWGEKEAVWLLNDFDSVLQVLFAEQSNTALLSHNKLRDKTGEPAVETLFERLISVWDSVLPHRKLIITGDNVYATVPMVEKRYLASQMSDGERAIFYLIAQVLIASEGSVLIIDEPELHVHRAIISNLWDRLEAARPDCSFVFITHDLEFAAHRVAAKFVVSQYLPKPQWQIESVPDETGFSEELTTLILGSRRPILFVEGSESSLDLAVYRACYPNWTVIYKGSCEDVIHSVATLRNHPQLTRITCAGLVDADDYSDEDITLLELLGIKVLPVSELENLFLLPNIVKEICRSEGHTDKQVEVKLAEIYDSIFDVATDSAQQELVVARYCRRRIDRLLKKIDLSSAKTIDSLVQMYADKTEELNIVSIASEASSRISTAINGRDISQLLRCFDNKGLLNILASSSKGMKQKKFESWIIRIMSNGTHERVLEAVKSYLPYVHAK
jgi:ABC-type branched-subunit amino acid transport system ATPase component